MIFTLELFVFMKVYAQDNDETLLNNAKKHWDLVLQNDNKINNESYTSEVNYLYCFNVDKEGSIISLDTNNLFVIDRFESIYHLFKYSKNSNSFTLIKTKEGDFNFRVFELIKSASVLGNIIYLLRLEDENLNILFNVKVIAAFRKENNHQYLVEFLSNNSSQEPGLTSLAAKDYYIKNRTQLVLEDIKNALDK
jgi:hypothetical protein